MVSVSVDGVSVGALVDTGSTRSIICKRLATRIVDSDGCPIMAVNGQMMAYVGTGDVRL